MSYVQAITAIESTVCANGRLRVLYFNPHSLHENGKEAIAQRGHDIFSATTSADGLDLLLEHSFDAVVIENEAEDLEVIDFTIAVNRLTSKVPVFLTSDWGPDLPIALEDVVTGAFATH